MKKRAICVEFNEPKKYWTKLIIGKSYIVELMTDTLLEDITRLRVFDENDNEKVIGNYPLHFFKTIKEIRQERLDEII